MRPVLAAIAIWSVAGAATAEDFALRFLGETEGATRGARVIGGIEVAAEDYPFYAALLSIRPDGRQGLCGAAAIAPRWLLTAAHCVQAVDEVNGRAGAIADAERLRAIPGGGIRALAKGVKVARVIPHPEFSKTFVLENDVALIELRETVPPPYIRLTPAGVDPRPPTKVRILGYGLTSFGGQTSQNLREAETRLVSRKDCAAVSRRLPRMGPIDERRICADVTNPFGPVDSCQGDSGGPLLAIDREGVWRSIGIVSYGYRCAEPGFPGVYANIATYRSWIDHVVSGGAADIADPPPVPALPEVGPAPTAAPTALSQIADLVDFGGVEIAVRRNDGPGGFVSFAITSALEGDLYVFDIGQNGDARQLFPNERTRKGRAPTRLRPQRARSLPAARDGFRLRAPQAGEERWIVGIVVDDAPAMARIASTRGLSEIPDAGEYLKDIVAAVAEPCVTEQVRCAVGALSFGGE